MQTHRAYFASFAKSPNVVAAPGTALEPNAEIVFTVFHFFGENTLKEVLTGLRGSTYDSTF